MQNSKSVAILGMGYVGLPLALAASSAGWRVFGIDIDEARIEQLRSGVSYVEDISNEALQNGLQAGFVATNDPQVIAQCAIAIICVPTPLSGYEPDLSALKSAVSAIAQNASAETLLINESTSFPSTVRDLIPSIVKKESPNLDLLYAVAPERVDPGNESWSYGKTPRLVAGLTNEATNRAYDFYSSFCERVIKVSSPEIAEFSKVLENSFRQVNIALVNELVPLAQDLGISLFEVIEAAGTKPYGYMPFWPGVGVGGHCIPVDPMYLSWLAHSRGIESTLIDAAQKVNNEAPTRILKIIESIGLNEHSLLLQVGLSYKAGVSDLRESPSLELFQLLQKKFRQVEWWDSSLQHWGKLNRSSLQSDYDLVVLTHRCESSELESTIKRSRKVLDLTGQFRGLSNVISI
ncbi:MAG: nucleotide sugar dehydrogenase [Micrococcales bacterium]|nr:nucleotide sugar dehydrogenase [Micrococcales bacterium]